VPGKTRGYYKLKQNKSKNRNILKGEHDVQKNNLYSIDGIAVNGFGDNGVGI
jgi:hypothetical protein